MRPSRVSSGLVLITTFAATNNALQILSSSPCAVQCGNVLGSTSGNELTCFDDSYSSSAGVVFESCMNCLLASKWDSPANASQTQDTDLRWLLYNLRYTMSWCLFGFPNNTDIGTSPCQTSTACGDSSSSGSAQAAVEFDSLSPNASTYSYCALMPEVKVTDCHNCLAAQTQQFFLTNMLTVLDAACQQQPTPGNLLAIEGSIFSKIAVNITDPATLDSSTTAGKQGGLSLEAKVAVAVSAILVFLLISGCCVVAVGKRRRRRALAEHQQKTGYATWIAQQQAGNPQQAPSMLEPNSATSELHDSPASQQPLVRGNLWGQPQEGSPASAFGEKVYFSPYSSQYSSPVSAQKQIQVAAREWPADRKGSIGGAFTGLGRSKSIEKRPMEEEEGDRYEMHNVAPLLQHPGNGRERRSDEGHAL
ncbi:hypothetical protein BJ878DRAFT_417407 [Calycina marina]|uniref:LPXTG-domain-containing protein n=1 Tax=Calycina marina TaxID=1763456 RepID=A0A9P7Z6N3_9HELO|nr:hypothetical protein BJ878DRAFT_417407 [Calycina marina]